VVGTTILDPTLDPTAEGVGGTAAYPNISNMSSTARPLVTALKRDVSAPVLTPAGCCCTARQRRDQRGRVRDPQVCALARDLGDRSGRQRSTIVPSAMLKILTPQKTTSHPVGGSPITEAR
jgi:hypothetical protein